MLRSLPLYIAMSASASSVLRSWPLRAIEMPIVASGRIILGPRSSGSREREADPVGEAQNVGQPRVGQHEGELVAAEPVDALALPGDAFEPAGDLHQHSVSGLVPEGVVDRLEVVEVEQEDGSASFMVGGALGQGMVGALGEEHAVAEPGERVVQGLVGEVVRETPQLLLGPDLRGVVDHQAGQSHRQEPHERECRDGRDQHRQVALMRGTRR